MFKVSKYKLSLHIYHYPINFHGEWGGEKKVETFFFSFVSIQLISTESGEYVTGKLRTGILHIVSIQLISTESGEQFLFFSLLGTIREVSIQLISTESGEMELWVLRVQRL